MDQNQLIICDTCSEKISNKATHCPHCGHDYTVYPHSQAAKDLKISKPKAKKKGLLNTNISFMGFLAIVAIAWWIFHDMPTSDKKDRKIQTTKEYDITKSPSYTKMVKHLQSGAESQIKDVTWSSRHVLRIGVLHDGSDRSRLAMYVCELFADFGINRTNKRVNVYDIEALTQQDKWIKIGQHDC